LATVLPSAVIVSIVGTMCSVSTKVIRVATTDIHIAK
jgi:hypothetical protein